MIRHLLEVEYFKSDSVSLLVETKDNVDKEELLGKVANSDYAISKGKTCKLVSLKSDKVKTIKYTTSTKIED